MTRGMSRVFAACAVGLCALWVALGALWAKDPKARLQDALKDHWIVGDWNYDDIGRARIRAAKEDKPVLVVFR